MENRKIRFIYQKIAYQLNKSILEDGVITLGGYTLQIRQYQLDKVWLLVGETDAPRELQENNDWVTDYLYNRLQDQDYGQKVFSVFYSTFYDYFVEFFCDNDDAIANAGLNEKVDDFLKSIKDNLLNDSDIKNIMLSLKTQENAISSLQSSINCLKECQKQLDIATFNAKNQFAEK